VNILNKMELHESGMMKGKRVNFRKIKQDDLRILRDWRNSTEIREYNSQFTLLNMVDQTKWFEQINKKNSKSMLEQRNV